MRRTLDSRRRRLLGLTGLVVGVLVSACSAGGDQQATPASASTASSFGGWTAAGLSDVTEVAPYDGLVAARDSLTLSSSASGTVTRGSAVGATLQPGDRWLSVDENPVAVMPGAVPMYRDLLKPADESQPPPQGEDVRQLQQFLTAQGDFSGTVNGTFSDSLGRAASRWRTHHDMTAALGFARSELAFLAGAGPWTVTEVDATVGEAFAGGAALKVSSGDLAVTVELDATPPAGAAYVLVPPAGANSADLALSPVGAATLTPENKYALQLTPPAGSTALTPGTAVIVEQRLVLAAQAVTVPVAAVRVDATGHTYVECREPDAAATRCPVSLGPTNGTDVAVTEGLTAGTEVATAP
jgi:hypothetical protein